jgi:glycosyltransferase involved in cell wall biosynthesis
MNKPLLTIAIPTYNRAHLLDLCLGRITDQARESQEEIEVLVSNNASTDNTKSIVEKYLNAYSNLRYTENEKNKGPDYNIAKCFKLARASYVWIFSDDDLLLPRSIERIVPLLKTHNLGIITLAVNFYPCTGPIDERIFPHEPLSYKLYDDPHELAQEVHFWLTYITGVIVNKKITSESKMYYPNEDSFLIQLGWVIPSLFSKLPSAKVETPLILGRALEVLDFKLFYVFGTSYPSVLQELARQGVLPSDTKDMLVELIITKYFVHYITPQYHFNHGERPLLILGKSFWNRKSFWRHLFPQFVRRGLYRIRRRTSLPLASVAKRLFSRIIVNQNRPRL